MQRRSWSVALSAVQRHHGFTTRYVLRNACGALLRGIFRLPVLMQPKPLFTLGCASSRVYLSTVFLQSIGYNCCAPRPDCSETLDSVSLEVLVKIIKILLRYLRYV